MWWITHVDSAVDWCVLVFAGAIPERVLPSAPSKSTVVHAGGCTGLAIESPGHMAATCGMDRVVRSFDLNLMESTNVYQVCKVCE